MRVLVLGGGGMLGHKLVDVFAQAHDTWVTTRAPGASYERWGVFEGATHIDGVDAADPAHLDGIFDKARPHVVLNAIGIVKQLKEAKDAVTSVTVNALLPHLLAERCAATGARLVHFGTDCVFSGAKGGYREEDLPDPMDLYGRSKLLGEVEGAGSLTLRTSIIGRELGAGAHGLVEWFLAQPGPTVPGYANAVFSGLPTVTLSRLVLDVVERHPDLSGMYHVSVDPIAKADLLELLAKSLGLDVQIERVPEPRIDRSLDSTRFRQATDWSPPAWPELVDELVEDAVDYGVRRT